METPRNPCLDAHTFAALVRPGTLAGDLKHAAHHLLGTPESGGCRLCRDRLAALFLAASDPEDRETAAARALREGACSEEPELLRQILRAEPADAATLAHWERWQETRDGAADPRVVPAVILSSSVLRFEPGAPGLLSHARLAAALAEASGDPWMQSVAQSWLTRVRAIRGELREAARALDAAQKAAERLEGGAHAVARAYALYQSADLRLRLRDFSAARERFERSAEMFRRLDPPILAHYPEIGRVNALTEAGQWEEAREGLRRLLGESRGWRSGRSACGSWRGSPGRTSASGPVRSGGTAGSPGRWEPRRPLWPSIARPALCSSRRLRTRRVFTRPPRSPWTPWE